MSKKLSLLESKKEFLIIVFKGETGAGTGIGEVKEIHNFFPTFIVTNRTGASSGDHLQKKNS